MASHNYMIRVKVVDTQAIDPDNFQDIAVVANTLEEAEALAIAEVSGLVDTSRYTVSTNISLGEGPFQFPQTGQ